MWHPEYGYVTTSAGFSPEFEGAALWYGKDAAHLIGLNVGMVALLCAVNPDQEAARLPCQFVPEHRTTQ